MMTLMQIAELIGSTVTGNSGIEITGVESIEGARSGDLTFAVDESACARLVGCAASASLVSRGTEDCALPCIQCDDVQVAFATVANHLRPAIQRPLMGVCPGAYVSKTAVLGEKVSIYPGAYVGDGCNIGDGTTVYPGVCIMENCRVGSDVSVFPNAVLYENTIVGDRSIIHANSVIGAYGFGYESSEQGHKLSAQYGNVELGPDVDIGACTTIDRGTFGTTRIGAGSKLDNQVMVGHNCLVGSNNLLCSQVGIAGSTRTGSFVVMAGQVGVSDHLTIGDGAIMGATSGVMHNLEGGQTYLGAPAIPTRDRLQVIASQAKLPEMRKQLKKLQRQIDRIESQMSDDSADDSADDANRKAA